MLFNSYETIFSHAHAQRILTLQNLLHWNFNVTRIQIINIQRIISNFGSNDVRTFSARNDVFILKIGLFNPL